MQRLSTTEVTGSTAVTYHHGPLMSWKILLGGYGSLTLNLLLPSSPFLAALWTLEADRG